MSTTESAANRALRRITEEMSAKNLNQTDVAGILGWGPSRVSKILKRKIVLTVDDMAALCFAVSISPVEAVRDHGLEFCAEMTPSELRLVELLRQQSHTLLEGLLSMLMTARRVPTRVESRGVTKPRSLYGPTRKKTEQV